MERRAFLSTALASPLSAVLAAELPATESTAAVSEVAAIAPTVPPNPVTFVYLRSCKTSDGGSYPCELHGSAEDADSGIMPEHYIVEPRRFVAIDAAKRFRVIRGSWQCEKLRYNWDTSLTKEERQQMHRQEFDEAVRRMDATEGPTSLLDLPPGCECCPEYDEGDYDLLTLDKAIARVAKWNAETVEDEPEKRIPRGIPFYSQDWYFVVEVGEPIFGEVLSVKLDDNGVGREERTARYPLRVVRLPADILAQYPVEMEGGAA